MSERPQQTITTENVGKNETVFLNQIATWRGFDIERDGQAAEEWVNEKVALLQMQIDHSQLWFHIKVDFEKVRDVFLFAYLAHFGQNRKLGNVPYAMHLFGSLKQYIHIKEKEYALRRPPEFKKVDLTDDFIQLVLHDVLEDFLDGIDLEKEDQAHEFCLMAAYIRHRFGSKIGSFVADVATKFTKRPATVIPQNEVVEVDDDGIEHIKYEKAFSKMELSRIDFMALVLGIAESTHNAIGLILKTAERHDNLETVGELPGADRKAMETYNLAIACFAGRFRTPGKDLLHASFLHLYSGESHIVLEQLQKIIRERQSLDRKIFEAVSSELYREMDELLGYSGDYEIFYSPLNLWRAHEELVRRYMLQQDCVSEDGLNLLSSSVLEDPVFESVLQQTYLGRIVVVTKTQREAKKIASGNLTSFTKIGHKSNKGPGLFGNKTLLDMSGYCSERVSLQNVNHPERPLEIKLSSSDVHLSNEYGEVSYVKAGEDVVKEEYSVAPLVRFLKHLRKACNKERSGSFDRGKEALLKSQGCDLTILIDDIRTMISEIEKLNIYELITTRQ